MSTNKFKVPVYFYNDSFTSLDLSSGVFYDEVAFYDSYINGVLSFEDATFLNNITFENLDLGQNAKIDFSRATLPDTLFFKSINHIGNQIDLIAANITDTDGYNPELNGYRNPHYISLYKSDISKFHLDYFHFKLFFPAALNLPYDEKAAIYEALLNNFKTRGQIKSLEKLDIEYKEFKYSYKPAGRTGKHWLSYVDKWWWNYGYNKELVFVHAAFFLLFFTFITFMILGFLNDEVYSMDDLRYTIPLRMKKYRSADPDEQEANSSKYTIAGNNKLSDLFQREGLAIKILPAKAKKSIYSREYKTITYCLFIGAFTVFLFSFYGLERYVIKMNLMGNLLHHRYAKIKWAAGITAVILVLWVFREQLGKYTVMIAINNVFNRLWLSIVYTSKLFFPVFIKIEKLKYNHLLLVFYILFVYLIGLVCIGYMTNFIFQK